MIKFSSETSQAWKRAKLEVPYISHSRPEWTPKYPLKHKLPNAKKQWTEAQWNSSGFPMTKIPHDIPSMLKEEAWDQLISDLDSLDLISPYQKHELDKVKSWLVNGIPFRMKGPGTDPRKANHHLNQQETIMAIDKLAQFCVQGHVAGPIHSWKRRKDLKFISIFAKYQASDNSVRIINDHSYPKGKSFNEAIDERVVKELPIHVGQLRDFIHTVIQCGKNAVMSKFDMTSAYKFIPVTKEQYRLQAIMICGGLFIDMKLSYGDATACHYYSFFHKLVQDALVFNAITTPKQLVTICIDDSTIAVPEKSILWAANYGEKYKLIMNAIGAGTKEADPLRLKCFELETSGEVLGAWIDTSELTWSLSDTKLADILEKIDLIVNPKDASEVKIIKLKTLQQVIGKISALAQLCSNLKSAMAIINIEKAKFEAALSSENKLPARSQLPTVFLSRKAKEDLLDIRAVLACLKEHPIPLEDCKRTASLTVDIFFCGDASGQIELQNPAALGIFIPRQRRSEGYALSYILPRKWLLAKEGLSNNYSNTVLLELLSLITPIVELPHLFRNKVVRFQTDNMALTQIYRSMWPHKESTAYFTRALNFVTQALSIKLDVTWRKRRTDLFSRIADDLTHTDFKLVPGEIENRRVSTLPEPILSTLYSSCKTETQDYHTVVNKIKEFWQNNNVQFLESCLF